MCQNLFLVICAALWVASVDAAVISCKNYASDTYVALEDCQVPFFTDSRNIVLITFGGKTQGYRNRVHKVCQQAKTLNFFTTIIGFTDFDLMVNADFWTQHGDFLETNPRGYGFWLWKSYLVSSVLDMLNENDILIYVDAGCEVNSQGIERLNEYIQMLDYSDYGVLVFQMPHIEKKWTKSALLNYLNSDKKAKNTGQCVGGIHLWKKNEHSIHVSKKWYEICCIYELINDTRSSHESASFIDHRHDQSILSLLVKKYGSIKIADETYYTNWSEGANIPFLAKRIRD